MINKRMDCSGIFLLFKNSKMVSNWEKNPIRTNNKNSNKSTIRSAIMVPNALSNGTSSYFFNKMARDISPERGIVKFTK